MSYRSINGVNRRLYLNRRLFINQSQEIKYAYQANFALTKCTDLLGELSIEVN